MADRGFRVVRRERRTDVAYGVRHDDGTVTVAGNTAPSMDAAIPVFETLSTEPVDIVWDDE